MVRRLGGLHHAGSTSNSFIAALKLRDEPAWNRYLEIYQRLILRRYLQAGLSFDLAEELAHNVTAEVHNRIGTFVPGNFRGRIFPHHRYQPHCDLPRLPGLRPVFRR